VPEPSQASWFVRVVLPGLVSVVMPVPGLHDIQDARIIRLQHVHNSHPDATANYPQPHQAPASIRQEGSRRDRRGATAVSRTPQANSTGGR
jgi:hypothetical protein